jgi:hypothetical protein
LTRAEEFRHRAAGLIHRASEAATEGDALALVDKAQYCLRLAEHANAVDRMRPPKSFETR